VTIAGLSKQLEDFPELRKLIEEVERQTSILNCAKTEDEKVEEKQKLEDACKK
jgi:hypothetical protein